MICLQGQVVRAEPAFLFAAGDSVDAESGGVELGASPRLLARRTRSELWVLVAVRFMDAAGARSHWLLAVAAGREFGAVSSGEGLASSGEEAGGGGDGFFRGHRFSFAGLRTGPEVPPSDAPLTVGTARRSLAGFQPGDTGLVFAGDANQDHDVVVGLFPGGGDLRLKRSAQTTDLAGKTSIETVVVAAVEEDADEDGEGGDADGEDGCDHFGAPMWPVATVLVIHMQRSVCQ